MQHSHLKCCAPENLMQMFPIRVRNGKAFQHWFGKNQCGLLRLNWLFREEFSLSRVTGGWHLFCLAAALVLGSFKLLHFTPPPDGLF